MKIVRSKKTMPVINPAVHNAEAVAKTIQESIKKNLEGFDGDLIIEKTILEIQSSMVKLLQEYLPDDFDKIKFVVSGNPDERTVDIIPVNKFTEDLFR